MRIPIVTIIVLVFTLSAFAQTSPLPKSEAPDIPQHHRHEDDEEALPASAASVPGDSSVITIEGVCEHNKPGATDQSPVSQSTGGSSPQQASSGYKPSECKTIVTKMQFEKLVDALNPKMSGMVKRQLADSYPRLLLFADKARDLGLEQDPGFAVRMQFAAIQILAQSLNRYFEQQANTISDADLEAYYKANPLKFERAELLRILVPKQGREASKPKPDNQADDAMISIAKKLQARAAAGEDFGKLQEEAFEAANIHSAGAPNVNMGKVAATRLPLNQQKIFEMEPGQVSELLADPSGYYIYKLVTKEFIPLSQADREIRKSIASQRVQESVNSLTKSLKFDLNPMYFGPTRSNAQTDQPPANKEDGQTN